MVTLRQVYNHMIKCDPKALDMPIHVGDGPYNMESFEVQWHSEEDDECMSEQCKNEYLEEFDPEYSSLTGLQYAEQFKKVLVLN